MIKVDPFWKRTIAGFDPWINCDGYYFDENVANRICSAIEDNCKYDKGAFFNKNYKLMDWQRQYYGHLFGWKTAEDKRIRRFRSSFVYIPRKNGKTATIAPLVPIGLKYDQEPGAEVYCCAATKEQASVLYGKSHFIIQTNEKWRQGIKAYKSTKTMLYKNSAGLLMGTAKVLASDGDNILGLEPSLYIIDEVLAQKKFDVMENLESGVLVREQPLGLYLSTAPDDGFNPCQNKLEYARGVQRNEINDPRYFPLMWEADPSEDWTDEELWKRVNPSIDVTVTLKSMREEFNKALISKVEEIKFKRRYLNMSVSSSESWLDMSDFSRLERIPDDHAYGEDCFGGFDLSVSDDITAVAFYFPKLNAVKCFHYCPEQKYRQKLDYGTVFTDYLRLIPGHVIDLDVIYKDIKEEFSKKYNILSIGFDPYHAKDLVRKLEADKFDMVKVTQTPAALTYPITEMEKSIKMHTLRLVGDVEDIVFRWNAQNCICKVGNDDKTCRIQKKYPGSPAKIDGMIAAIIAKALEIEHEPQAQSQYNNGGMGITFI